MHREVGDLATSLICKYICYKSIELNKTFTELHMNFDLRAFAFSFYTKHDMTFFMQICILNILHFKQAILLQVYLHNHCFEKRKSKLEEEREVRVIVLVTLFNETGGVEKYLLRM